ncbi:hypothetical protein JUNP479_0039 [Aeromonas jandaei]|nr:hypothetical protein JUNP479_0039 [Aeromonas jandaei]
MPTASLAIIEEPDRSTLAKPVGLVTIEHIYSLEQDGKNETMDWIGRTAC